MGRVNLVKKFEKIVDFVNALAIIYAHAKIYGYWIGTPFWIFTRLGFSWRDASFLKKRVYERIDSILANLSPQGRIGKRLYRKLRSVRKELVWLLYDATERREYLPKDVARDVYNQVMSWWRDVTNS